jgi:hypothetical protein
MGRLEHDGFLAAFKLAEKRARPSSAVRKTPMTPTAGVDLPLAAR